MKHQNLSNSSIMNLFLFIIISHCVITFIIYYIRRGSTVDKSFEISDSMQSVLFLEVISAEIAVSAFLLVELYLNASKLTAGELFRKSEFLVNLFVTTMWFSTGATKLFFIVPKSDYFMMISVTTLQYTGLVCNVGIYAYNNGGEIWRNGFTIACVLLVSASMLTIVLLVSFYGEKTIFFTFLENLCRVFLSVATIIYTYLLIRWIHKIFSSWKNKKTISWSDWNFTINISLYTMVGLVFILVAFMFGTKQFTDSSVALLCFVDVAFLLYFSIQSIYQSRSMRAATELEHAEMEKRLKHMVIGYFSHELRTPLNSIIMGIQLLKADLTSSVTTTNHLSTSLETITDIEASCGLVIDILKDLLTYDQLEDNSVKLTSEEVFVQPIILQKLDAFKTIAQERNIRFTVGGLEDITQLRIFGQEDTIHQIFRNVLAHSFDSASGNGILTSGAVDVSMEVLSGITVDTFQIQIRDSGPPVPQHAEEELFTNYNLSFQSGVIDRGQSGGLGLLIAHRLLELHKGSLAFCMSRHLGKDWNTFTVTFPIVWGNSGRLRHGSPLMRSLLYATEPIHPVASIGRKWDGMTGEHITDAVSETGISKVPPAGPSGVGDYRRRHSLLEIPSFHDHSVNSQEFEQLHPHIDGTTRRDILVDIEDEPEAKGSQEDSIGQQLQQESKRFDYHRVLIVDDAIMNRKLLSRLLKPYCQTMIIVEDGLVAVDAVTESMHTNQPFDFVLMDYQMPRMDGPSAAKCMRELGYTGPIIGVTGNVQSFQLDTYISKGANRVLPKPLVFDDLKAALRELMTSTNVTQFDTTERE